MRQMQVEYVRDYISENAPGPFVRLKIPTRHGGFAEYDLDPTQWARLRNLVDGWMSDQKMAGAGVVI